MTDQVHNRHKADRQIGIWIFSIAGLIFLMVLVGGITRLTDSGLSITEWDPIMGALPPMSDAAWNDAFEKYKEIPEYKLINKGMSLEEFKFIFFWEWFHRLLGRFIGLAFAIPFLYFLLTRKIERRLTPKLAGIFVLGGAQGALGWYMVMSGLVDRVDVSQYRLTAHLGVAVILYVFCLWVAFGLLFKKRELPSAPQPSNRRAWAYGFASLVFLQILLGGLVAGLDAGIGYNTWPLMDGAFIPVGLLGEGTGLIGVFEHPKTVQFDHRMIAYLITILAAVLWVVGRRGASGQVARTLDWVLIAVLAQVLLGILTLVFFVPLWLGVAHQGGALIVLGFSVYYVYLLRRPATNS